MTLIKGLCAEFFKYDVFDMLYQEKGATFKTSISLHLATELLVCLMIAYSLQTGDVFIALWQSPWDVLRQGSSGEVKTCNREIIKYFFNLIAIITWVVQIFQSSPDFPELSRFSCFFFYNHGLFLILQIPYVFAAISIMEQNIYCVFINIWNLVYLPWVFR